MIRNAGVTDRNIEAFWFCLSHARRRCISQGTKCGDYDYPEGHKLDQIFWSLFVAVSISEETTSACEPGCNGFHVCNTPFIAGDCVDWRIFTLPTLTVAYQDALHRKSNAVVTFERRIRKAGTQENL